MIELHILRPTRDAAPTRYGEPLVIEVDLELDEPWFEVPGPQLGSPIANFDGEPEPALFFDAHGPKQVRTLISGRAEVRDTGVEDHAGHPLYSTRAGRGVEVAVASGGFQLIYSHLRRGSTRVGPVRAGDAIGETGNTGRCLSGAKRHFLKIASRTRGVFQRPADFAEPITVLAMFNGKPIGRMTRIPAGERVFKRYELDRVLVEQKDAEFFRPGENELEVHVKRGARVLARASGIAPIDYS